MMIKFTLPLWISANNIRCLGIKSDGSINGLNFCNNF